MFMNLDQTLFISITTLRVAAMDEPKLALFISHELAHYLMDHQVSRLVNMLFREYIWTPWVGKWQQKDVYDPVREDFK